MIASKVATLVSLSLQVRARGTEGRANLPGEQPRGDGGRSGGEWNHLSADLQPQAHHRQTGSLVFNFISCFTAYMYSLGQTHLFKKKV